MIWLLGFIVGLCVLNLFTLLGVIWYARKTILSPPMLVSGNMPESVLQEWKKTGRMGGPVQLVPKAPDKSVILMTQERDEQILDGND